MKAIDPAMRVGQLVTAVEDFTGWEGPETRLSFSTFPKQMLEVAVLVGEISDRELFDLMSCVIACRDAI
jgi:hypothetical protein